MKKLYALITLLVFLFTASSAMALDPEPIFYLQDDFTIEYGETGDPLSSGTTLKADGRLLFSETLQIAAWFKLEDAVSVEGEDLGDMWKLKFNSGIFTIHSEIDGGTILWEGEISEFYFSYTKNLSYFTLPTEISPAFGVDLYQGYGNGKFIRSSLIPATEMWDIEQIDLINMGAERINYLPNNKGIIGNMNGTLVVPEPGTVAAMLTGLAGLGISGVLRRKKS